MPRVIGLSLSNCVNDIVAGRVAYDNVEQIISRTACPDAAVWAKTLASYEQGAWKGNKQATEIAVRLLQEGKIDQPRLRGEPVPVDILKEDSYWRSAQKGTQIPLTKAQQVEASGLESARAAHEIMETPLPDQIARGKELETQIAAFLPEAAPVLAGGKLR
jgi:hypothetical protein